MRNILVLGVCDCARSPNTAPQTMRELRQSAHSVHQAWVRIGDPDGDWSPSQKRVLDECAALIVDPQESDQFHFLLNRMIRARRIFLDAYDYVVLAQDDAGIEGGWLDRMISLMEELRFDAAAGARPKGSFIAHAHTRVRPGCRARRVRMIEEGPIAVYSRRAMKVKACWKELAEYENPAPGAACVPRYVMLFPESLRWGFDVRFAYDAERAGLRLGIADCCPADHVRPYYRGPQKDRWKAEFWKAVRSGRANILQADRWTEVLEVCS